jgi:hypothetical protein
VCEGVSNQIGNVSIRQSVVQMKSRAAARDKPLGTKDAQPLGNRRELFSHSRNQFGNAAFPAAQHLEQPEPRHIAQCPENARRSIQSSGGGVGNTRFCRVIAHMAFWSRMHFLHVRLLNSIISSNSVIVAEETSSSSAPSRVTSTHQAVSGHLQNLGCKPCQMNR